MLRASIDIGSNSILLLISEFKNGKFEDIENEVTITSLGRGLDENKKFLDKSIDATFDALKSYKKIIKRYDLTPDETIVTATEASRVAENAKSFFEQVKKKLGFDVSIINSEGEAFYTAKGVVTGAGLQSEDITIMDIGGASTELIKVKTEPFSIVETISLPVGSVRAYDWIEEGIFQEKMEKIFKDFGLGSYKTQNLLCVAGTMTSIGAMILGLSNFQESSVNDSEVQFSKFCEYLEKIKVLDEDTLKVQYPFLGKRSKTIVSGARVARAIGLELEVESFKISTLGLRYGVLLEDKIQEKFMA